jgi:ribonuclease HI
VSNYPVNLGDEDKSLEWQSVLHALRDIPVAQRAALGAQGVIAYTDGACIKNPGGPAGWSVILLAAGDVTNNVAREGAERIECSGHIPKSETTTNNRAEITAVLAALCIAPNDRPLTIYSDSEYTINVASGKYKIKANSDLWSLYHMLLNRRSLSPKYSWVQGHSGHDLNERADELAGQGAFNHNLEAYREWQASNTPEARNMLPAGELAALRLHVQKLKTFIESLDRYSTRVSPTERQFIEDMAKRLQKNNFSPSPKQVNWLKGLVTKYKV